MARWVISMFLLMMVAGAIWLANPTKAAAAGASSNKPVVTFGIQPASSTKPDGRGYFSFNATPGAQIHDYAAVINYSYQPLVLSLHVADATNTAEGDFALEPPDRPAPNLGSWIHLLPSQASVTVPARTLGGSVPVVIVPFSIMVPPKADPGDHIGGILATLESEITSPSGQRIHLLQSVGTRIFVRVSGPLHPSLAVQGLNVSYEGSANPLGKGTAILTYRVKNTGNVGLGGNQTVWVSGLFGSKTYAVKVPTVKLLLPGNSVGERVRLPGFFPEFRETAHVSISPLVIPGSVQPPSGPFQADVSFWAVPWTLLAIIVVLLGAIVAAILIRRRRRRPPKDQPGGPSSPPAASGHADLRDTPGVPDAPQAPNEGRPSVPVGAEASGNGTGAAGRSSAGGASNAGRTSGADQEHE
jgi:hypothetical protein